MVTRRGTVKKTELTAVPAAPWAAGSSRLGLDEGDELIGVARTKAGDQVVLSTRDGMAIRFDESDVRAMGRPALRRQGDRAWRRTTRSSAWSSPTATTTRRAS